MIYLELNYINQGIIRDYMNFDFKTDFETFN
jgi:hypothetical protein